jgi:repressor LexA
MTVFQKNCFHRRRRSGAPLNTPHKLQGEAASPPFAPHRSVLGIRALYVLIIQPLPPFVKRMIDNRTQYVYNFIEVKPMNFSDRLRNLRKEAGLSQRALGELCGISKSSINMYERGEREPGFAAVDRLCEILNTDPSYLLGGKETKTALPLLGEIACGAPIFTNQEEGFADGLEADFCLRARGDSMIGARIADGDLVFIKQQETVKDGEIAAVIIEDTATLKRVYFSPVEGRLTLVAENPRYAPLVFSGEELEQVKILGKAVGFRSELH